MKLLSIPLRHLLSLLRWTILHHIHLKNDLAVVGMEMEGIDGTINPVNSSFSRTDEVDLWENIP